HRLLVLAVQPGALTPVPTSQLKGGSTLLMGVDRPLHACHWSVLSMSWGAAKAPGDGGAGLGGRPARRRPRRCGDSATEQLLEARDVARRHFGRTLEAAGQRAGLLLEQVSPTRALPQQLAG